MFLTSPIANKHAPAGEKLFLGGLQPGPGSSKIVPIGLLSVFIECCIPFVNGVVTFASQQKTELLTYLLARWTCKLEFCLDLQSAFQMNSQPFGKVAPFVYRARTVRENPAPHPESPLAQIVGMDKKPYRPFSPRLRLEFV